MKRGYIDAVKWFFGMSHKEAVKYIKEAGEDAVKEIYKAYAANVVKSFYND